MPDDRDRNPDAMTPPGWAEAFAALPPETPPDDGWRRIAARLPKRKRPHWQVWGAIAAVLAIVALSPFVPVSPDASRPAPGTGSAASTEPPAVASSVDDTEAADAATTPPLRPPQDAEPNPQAERVRVAETESAPPGGAGGTPARSSPQASGAPASDRPVAAAETGATSPRRPAGASDAVIADPVNADAVVVDADIAAEATATPSELERLYAESAQLEALLALARDDRVASGTAAALASEYGEQLAAIDAALMQPDLRPARHTELWRDRVAALRQLAAFESTRRLLAAEGERYDTMLVSID